MDIIGGSSLPTKDCLHQDMEDEKKRTPGGGAGQEQDRP